MRRVRSSKCGHAVRNFRFNSDNLIMLRKHTPIFPRLIPLFIYNALAVGANVFPALAQVPFYQDKTITVILGGPPAGSADLRTRSVVNILRKHIPGNPNIIMQYMAGGGGRQAANHVYRVAKPDGLMVGSMGAALVANAVLGEPGV